MFNNTRTCHEHGFVVGSFVSFSGSSHTLLGKLVCSNVRGIQRSFKMVWSLQHAAQLQVSQGRHLNLRPSRRLLVKSKQKFLSQQVRMSRCLDMLSNTCRLTEHTHGTDIMSLVLQSDLPLDPNLFSRTNFSMTACSNVAPSLKIHRI